MKINIELNLSLKQISIKAASNEKTPDLLAYATLNFIDESERYFAVNGFTIRRSKHNQKPYLVPPSKSLGKDRGFFKYVLTETSLWKEIERAIVKEYEFSTIPIVEEK